MAMVFEANGVVAVGTDTSALEAVLKQIQSQAKNLRNVLEIVASDMVGAVEENFESEGAASPAGKWKELAPETIKRRRKEGKGAQILQDTGVMAASVMPDFGDDYAMAFTNNEYAVFHVSPEPREVIPLRDFFNVDMELIQQDAVDLIAAQVVGA
jgi:phage gpG-like protein